jgi:CopG family transcriptional regulator/antitoxin EndoAI
MDRPKRIREQATGHAEVREAGEHYGQDRQRDGWAAMMQRGYAEMGAINLGLATEAFQAEDEVNRTTRHKASGV